MGKGGMRCGAGRPSRHVKAEHCRSIDVLRFQREGLLRSGTSTGWAWTDRDTGEQVASIGLRGGDGHLTLIYTLNGADMHQHVPVEQTPCTYGGTRAWFNCPRCAKRVALLYLRANGFACRRCQRITYASRSDDAIDRTWRRQSKLETRLGLHWKRPKGMHRATRDRLIAEIHACEELREHELASCVATHMLHLA